MGFLDKFKEMFTEEIEEPVPVKREVRHVETTVQPVKKEEVKVEPVKKEEPVVEPEPKEEKFVFFSDDDFKDLEKPKREERHAERRVEPKREQKNLAYQGAVPQPKFEPKKKEFRPSPIISPVYGVLGENYKKDEETKKTKPTRVYRSSTITIDDVRNKAYGTLEDEITDDMLGKVLVEKDEPEVVEDNINLFEELDKYEDNEIVEPEVVSYRTGDVDEIFDKLDNKKDEILDELDNKKVEILDEIDNKKDKEQVEEKNDSENIETDNKESSDVLLSKNLLEDSIENVETDNNIDEETENLAKELEEQKKKLEEINSLIDEKPKTKKAKKTKKNDNDDLNESELFDIIDSMYEKEEEK